MIVVVAGAVPTVTANDVDAFPQLLVNVTPTFPDAALAPHVVVIELVPCPAVIVTFAGTVHTYDAPLCATTLYTTPVVFGQTLAFPVIVGVVGVLQLEVFQPLFQNLQKPSRAQFSEQFQKQYHPTFHQILQQLIHVLLHESFE